MEEELLGNSSREVGLGGWLPGPATGKRGRMPAKEWDAQALRPSVPFPQVHLPSAPTAHNRSLPPVCPDRDSCFEGSGPGLWHHHRGFVLSSTR